MSDYQNQQPGFNQPGAAPAAPEPSGLKGMFHDPSTLAATGLLVAVLFAVVAGILNFLADPGLGGDLQTRLMALTNTVDVGDIALLGIAVALLLLTPDPPGGIERHLLMKADAALATVIAIFAVIRTFLLLIESGTAVLARGSGFLATLGVAVAAATIAFYAAKESFLKEAEADDAAV